MSFNFCIFSAQYLPTVGGVERYTYNLAAKLVEQGSKVSIVTSRLKSTPDYENKNGIEIYRTPCYSLLNGRFPVSKKNKEFRNTMNILASKKFDHVIVNTRFYPLSLDGVRFASENNIRCMLIEHGTNHLTVNNHLLDYLGEKYEHYATEKLKLYCDNFYGVSEACNEWLVHFGIKAKGVVYNAIDLDTINNLLSSPLENYRKLYNIPDNAVVVSFVGRFVKEKGVKNLLEAVKRVNQKGKNVYLLMAGDGPLLESLKGQESDKIHFLGKLTYQNVIALLKNSDIFCLPSESEGFPTSVLEAVACKCFVITTYRGGARELISDDKLGVIMKSNSVDEIFKNIMEVSNDSNYRKTAVELAYKKLCENFSWDKVADNLIKSLK